MTLFSSYSQYNFGTQQSTTQSQNVQQTQASAQHSSHQAASNGNKVSTSGNQMASDSLNSNQNMSAPPLPPRKTSPNVADSSVNRSLKPTASVTVTTSLVNLSTNLSSATSRSSENVTTCEFDVPKGNAPPVPKHKTPTDANDADNERTSLTSIGDPAMIIVGEAETITGIIDTRPLEARKPIVTGNDTSSTASDTNKEQKLVTSNCANNVYHLKLSSNQQQQQQIQLNAQRHQSYPNYTQSSQSSSNYRTATCMDDSMLSKCKEYSDSSLIQGTKGKFQKS